MVERKEMSLGMEPGGVGVLRLSALFRATSDEFARMVGPKLTNHSYWLVMGSSHIDEFGRKAVRCTAAAARHGRRPMMRHAVKCKCIGADEACFANFIAVASEGNREDAMLIATLMVRPHLAAVITSLATDFGLALKQMRLAAPRKIATEQPLQTTFH